MSSCIGRFAPTPSGRMHLGNVFSALMAWASVRSQNGSFILRIEDLDIRAHNPQYTSLLLDDLQWLGLTWDKGPFSKASVGTLSGRSIEIETTGTFYILAFVPEQTYTLHKPLMPAMVHMSMREPAAT